MGFFGGLSAILAVISTIFIIPILEEFHRIGLVPHYPTLIVCGFVYLVAALSLFAGLILHNIRKKELREFEFRLQQADRFYKEEK